MSNRYCPKCDQVIYPGHIHKCPDVMHCVEILYNEGLENIDWKDAVPVPATDAEGAATAFSEDQDDGEPPCERDVAVRAPDGKVTRWKVHAECEVTYYADEIGGGP